MSLTSTLNPPITDWRGKTVWLVGASSGIGRATAHALHTMGACVIVSARNAAALDAFVLEHPGLDSQGGATAVALPLDASDPEAVKAAALQILKTRVIDSVIYCAGYFKEMRATEFKLGEMLKHQQINYLGAVYVLDAVLPHFIQRQAGHISLISSVAGYAGLPKSMAYGPTKAALINLAETLYLDLRDQGIGVSLICPGFVDTPLTAPNDFNMPGLISPEQAASAMLAGWAKGQFEIHFPKRFTLMMKALRLLPYRLYFPAIKKFTGL